MTLPASSTSGGHYELPLDREFPFHVTLFDFKSGRYTPTWNWHGRLELTLPLDGPTRMRMGEQTVQFEAGDLLVVDNFKLRNVEDFPGQFHCFKSSLQAIPMLAKLSNIVRSSSGPLP
jgi:hypothetical protein